MKKYLICLILGLTISTGAFAGIVDELLSDIAKHKKTENVKIGNFALSLAKMLGGVSNEAGVKNIKSMHVSTLSSAGKELEAFRKRVEELTNDDGYESMMLVKDGEETVRIMIKKQKDEICEMLILVVSDDDVTTVKMMGKITDAELQKMMNDKKNKK